MCTNWSSPGVACWSPLLSPDWRCGSIPNGRTVLAIRFLEAPWRDHHCYHRLPPEKSYRRVAPNYLWQIYNFRREYFKVWHCHNFVSRWDPLWISKTLSWITHRCKQRLATTHLKISNSNCSWNPRLKQHQRCHYNLKHWCTFPKFFFSFKKIQEIRLSICM